MQTVEMPPHIRLSLEALRRAIIAALNTLDDTLGLPRTIPGKQERRILQRIGQKDRELDIGLDTEPTV